ncbi:hypothetical protein [Achromobacter sp. NFACC18-2]|uniref:hypothetical protein n=1 Tax=Achromobacter sp. NFACC18-2 TaxID=1564112 RepID=UPI0008B813AC|nr:hypothetical protein [Achromobacter sp. NFACC18-2]SEJ72752.1 hypothetical protein SAMN03159494_03158 [Achromobacter sp. NFACC18-2]
MTGFLRQLANRSLGLAPRLRGAPTPQSAALHGAVPGEAAAPGMPGRAAAGGETAAFAPAWDVSASDSAAGRAAQAAFLRGPAAGPGLAAPAQHAGIAGIDTPRSRSMPPASADADMPPPLVARWNGSDGLPPAHRADSPPRGISGNSGSRTGDDARAGLTAAMPLDAQAPAWAPGMAPTRAGRAEREPGEPGASDKPGPPAPPAVQDDAASRQGAIDARTLTALAPRHAPQHAPAPDVHITIDRLEVAPPAPVPRAAPPARSAALSLRAYLAARRTGLP